MKRIIKRILAIITNWLEIPGELYLTDRYRYVRGVHIFPSRNIDMLTVAETVSMHNVLINLWAPENLSGRFIRLDAYQLLGSRKFSGRLISLDAYQFGTKILGKYKGFRAKWRLWLSN